MDYKNLFDNIQFVAFSDRQKSREDAIANRFDTQLIANALYILSAHGKIKDFCADTLEYLDKALSNNDRAGLSRWVYFYGGFFTDHFTMKNGLVFKKVYNKSGELQKDILQFSFTENGKAIEAYATSASISYENEKGKLVVLKRIPFVQLSSQIKGE